MNLLEEINICFIVVTFIVLGAAIKGYRTGLIQSINSFIGIIFALVALIIFVVISNAYIGKEYSKLLLGVISFIIVILIQKIISFIFSTLKLISKLPVIKYLDKVFGFFVGLIEGIVDFWIIGIVIIAFGNDVMINIVMMQIEENEILNFLFNNNLVALLITSI